MTRDHLKHELIIQDVLDTPELSAAFDEIDRADFVPEDFKDAAYENLPLPIGFNQTISQPFTVFFMLGLLDVKKGDRVLEIGTGSGWQTALLSFLAGKNGKVVSLERIFELVEFAKNNLSQYSEYYRASKVVHGDGSFGMPEFAPFDKIIAAAAAAEIPKAWKEQLKVGGKIIAPVEHDIIMLQKNSSDDFKKTVFEGFAFVPLVSE